MHAITIPDLKNVLYKTLEQSAISSIIDSILHSGGKPILCAGAVRDALISIEKGGTLSKPHDLDIGIAGLDRRRFDHLFRGIGAVPNKYGGYVVEEAECPLDIWRLEETCGIRVHGLQAFESNVLRSFVIAFNSVAFDLYTGRLNDYGCLQAIRSKQIDLNSDALLHGHSTFAAKALILSARLCLPLSASMRSFVAEFVEPQCFWHEFSKVFGLGHDNAALAFAELISRYPKIMGRVQARQAREAVHFSGRFYAPKEDRLNYENS